MKGCNNITALIFSDVFKMVDLAETLEIETRLIQLALLSWAFLYRAQQVDGGRVYGRTEVELGSSCAPSPIGHCYVRLQGKLRLVERVLDWVELDHANGNESAATNSTA